MKILVHRIVLVAATAILCAACATTNIREQSLEAVSLAGVPVADVIEAYGEPPFRHAGGSEVGIEYLGYRIYTDSGAAMHRCSVIYVVDDETIVEARPVGTRCHEQDRETRNVNRLVEELEGTPVGEILMMFGTPDAFDVTDDPDGTGTLTYDLGSSSSSSGPIGSGSVTASVGITMGCRMTLHIEGGLVASAEAGVGACWAWSF